MEKARIVSLDEEFESLQKSVPVARKQQWTKKTKTGKLVTAHRKKLLPTVEKQKTYKGKPYKNSSVPGYIWQKDDAGEPQLVKI